MYVIKTSSSTEVKIYEVVCGTSCLDCLPWRCRVANQKHALHQILKPGKNENGKKKKKEKKAHR